MEMKRRILALAVILVLLALVTSTALAGGATNGTLVKYGHGGGFYCEGYFLRTGSDIVHVWRNNPECVDFGGITSLHLVFKPYDKFDFECDDEGFLMGGGPWNLERSLYYDLPEEEDEGDIAEFLVGDYQVCIYTWD
jgi:hypothetical protein